MEKIIQIFIALFFVSLSACPIFRSSGEVVESVTDGAGEVADGVGNAVVGTGRAINKGVQGTADGLD